VSPFGHLSDVVALPQLGRSSLRPLLQPPPCRRLHARRGHGTTTLSPRYMHGTRPLLLRHTLRVRSSPPRTAARDHLFHAAIKAVCPPILIRYCTSRCRGCSDPPTTAVLVHPTRIISKDDANFELKFFQLFCFV
jgi:hypothetical protein